MNTKYRVTLLEGNLFSYKVEKHDDHHGWVSVFKGSLSDCESYIRLKGYHNAEFDQ